MHSVLERLQSEHGNLVRLTRLLDELACHAQPPQRSELVILVDTMYYLIHFPDASHHPMEDRMVERLRDGDDLPLGFATDLTSQHETLARQGQDLFRDLESMAREETLSWGNVAPNLRLYAERLRHNMTVEELILFPAAARQLSANDLSAIETPDSGTKADPLFGANVEERFRELRRVITKEAGCGCENPPS